MPRPGFEQPAPGFRLAFLGPHGEPEAGVSAIRVDLPALLLQVQRVGMEASLLLLALRALRARASGGTVRLDDLAWMLVARPGEVHGWLEQLSRARLVVYEQRHPTDLVVELAASTPDPRSWPLEGPVGPPRMLPTHLFTQVLPRTRRTAFLLYLALLAREETGPGVVRTTDEDLRNAVGARSRLQVRYELWRLRRLGLLRRTRSGRGLIVLDPPPLTVWNRRYLQLLQWGYRPLPWRRMAVASVAIALVVLILGYLVTHPRDALLRPPLRDDERADAHGLASVLSRT